MKKIIISYFIIIIVYFLTISTGQSIASDKDKLHTAKTPIRVNADNMESFKQKNMVSFTSNVVAYKKDMTIYSDKLDVYSDDEQKELKMIVAFGNVKILKDDLIATCEKAIYEEIEQRITLLGNPVLVKDDNVIEGKKIVYLIDKEEVSAFGDSQKRVEVTLFPEKLEKARGSKGN